MYWDPRSPTPLYKLAGNNARFDLGGVTSLAVSLSEGEVISALGCHADGECKLEVVVFVNVVGTSAPAGSASLNKVVTGATDGKVCIWDLKTNRLRTMFEHKVSPTFCSPLTVAAWRPFLSFLMPIERTSVDRMQLQAN